MVVVVASAQQLAGCRMVDSECMHSSAEAWFLAEAVDVEVVQGSSSSGECGLDAAMLSTRAVRYPAATAMDHVETEA